MTAIPVLTQINLIVRDIDAAVGFYRMLGLEIPDAPEWPPGSGARHTGVDRPGEASIDLDNPAMARIWHAGQRDGEEQPPPAVIGLSLPTDEAVDETFARAVSAGAAGVQPPYLAFWGARYAIVVDPDGNHVGLMGPIDRRRAYVPTPAPAATAADGPTT